QGRTPLPRGWQSEAHSACPGKDRYRLLPPYRAGAVVFSHDRPRQGTVFSEVSLHDRIDPSPLPKASAGWLLTPAAPHPAARPGILPPLEVPAQEGRRHRGNRRPGVGVVCPAGPEGEGRGSVRVRAGLLRRASGKEWPAALRPERG